MNVIRPIMKIPYLALLFTTIALAAPSDNESERLQWLLSHKFAGGYGPNCWNSVMYVKNIAPGIYYSEGIDFWQNSQLCQEAKRPINGDIINMSIFNEERKEFELVHSYIYLSEDQAFTKNGPGAESLYEIANPEHLLKNLEELPKHCMLKNLQEGMKLRCPSITTAYRCKNFNVTFPEIKQREEGKKLMAIADSFSAFSLDATLKINLSKYLPQLEAIKEIAAKKLGMPSYGSLPKSLQKSLFKYFNIDKDSDLDTDVFKNTVTENTYLLAHPEQQKKWRKDKQINLKIPRTN